MRLSVIVILTQNSTLKLNVSKHNPSALALPSVTVNRRQDCLHLNGFYPMVDYIEPARLAVRTNEE